MLCTYDWEATGQHGTSFPALLAAKHGHVTSSYSSSASGSDVGQVGLKAFKSADASSMLSICFCWLDADVNKILDQWFSNLSVPQNCLEGLLKHRLPAPLLVFLRGA